MAEKLAKQGRKGKPPQQASRVGEVKPAVWTIMLYIAADGNIANFAIETLKQLNRTAGGDPDHRVVVAVQFAVDAPGGQKIPRYIFDQANTGPTKNHIVDFLDAPDDMTEEEALASFLTWVYDDAKNPKCTAENYALILWGHGPELVFQPPSGQIQNDPCGDPGNDPSGLYLSPIELRNALREGIPQKNGKIDLKKKPRIIGMDACSMSFAEVAYEIRDYAEFMVASQEEVPDLSFPYDTLVQYFQQAGANAEWLCKFSVKEYVLAYQDYICDSNTGAKKVTLSSLRLRKLAALRKALARLSDALYAVRTEATLPDLLIPSRAAAKGFAGGLYVDLCNFCEKLRGSLEPCTKLPPKERQELISACDDVCSALTVNGGCILANQASDPESHGLSIYFPYMTNDQLTEVRAPLVKGGRDTAGKGFTAVMNRSAANVMLSIRRQIILDTEKYYEDLALSQETNWYRFIAKQWSAILASSITQDLDIKYSAVQAAANALKDL